MAENASIETADRFLAGAEATLAMLVTHRKQASGRFS
jgi:hypothetical protein